MNYLDIVKAQLKLDEGTRAKPYRDTMGKLTIGVGRNLDDVGLRPNEIEYLLDNDVAVADHEARTLFPTFEDLSEPRKAVILNMSFELGQEHLAAFHDLRAAVAAGDYEKAAEAMLASRWAKEVPLRAERLVASMRAG